MSPLRFLCFNLFLICILLFSEAVNNCKKNAEVLINFFANEEWKNLKDVKNVDFYTKFFSLETIYESKIDLYNCNNKVRAATLVLGCSYVKDLKAFYFIFYYFIINCKKLYTEQKYKTLGDACIKKLLIIMNKINLLLKIMKGTLKALDIMHTKPWKENKGHDLLFLGLLSFLQENHEVLKNTLLIDDALITNKLFALIITLLNEKQSIIEYKSRHCNYIPYNLSEMSQKWNEEYNILTKNGDKLHYYEYLSKKLHDIIKQIMVEKFINLGFKYDSTVQKIVVPIPEQLNSDNNTNYGFTDEMTALIQNESKDDTKQNNNTNYGFTDEMTALIQNESKDDTKQNNNINYALIDEMIALIQNASKEDTELTISNEELEVPVENPGMPETINFFPGAISNEELEVPVENPGMPETINFFPGVICNKELEVPDVNPRTPELINFFQEEVPSGDPKTPELIDFLEQGLNPGVSTEDILEPLDIDKKKITMFNFL
ncbi:uncharacterized protein LOC126908461 isoform X2 [Daktulosphaira vitifoliae]|uniref:uncharacterized protein LOC126908461 isoform X2 n=1 Tax=Daktulosphaira vitifoliae TaxID=58002 RepID=UPI0021AA7D9F|nr:uncharacterized protein LOC126908461 isoform X2 [Daktulosphaira vitifoliae]